MNPGHCGRDQATLLMMWQVRTIDVGGRFHSKVIRTQCVVLPLLMCNVVARAGPARVACCRPLNVSRVWCGKEPTASCSPPRFACVVLVDSPPPVASSGRGVSDFFITRRVGTHQRHRRGVLAGGFNIASVLVGRPASARPGRRCGQILALCKTRALSRVC